MISREQLNKFISNVNMDGEKQDRVYHYKKIVAVSPHPDDMELLAGGLMKLYTSNSRDVDLIVVSDGRKGSLGYMDEETLIDIRRDEQLQAAKVLGLKKVHFLEYVDSEVPCPRILRKKILPLIRELAPDLVITVDPFLPYESHLDHVNTGKAVMESVLFFEHGGIEKGYAGGKRPDLLLAGTAYPNIIVDIEKYFGDKEAAIKCHISQFESTDYIFKAINTLENAYGKLIGSDHGEPFRLLYSNELHLNTVINL